MKWMLFLVLTTGSPPTTPGHFVSQVIKFDDRLMCEGFLDDMRTRLRSQWRVDVGFCFPSSSSQLDADRLRGYAEKFPQHFGAK